MSCCKMSDLSLDGTELLLTARTGAPSESRRHEATAMYLAKSIQLHDLQFRTFDVSAIISEWQIRMHGTHDTMH